MTDNEKAAQLGQIHLSLQRNREELACLISKARYIQEELSAVIGETRYFKSEDLPVTIKDLRADELLMSISKSIRTIRRLEKEIKQITPDFYPARLPS